MKCYTYKTVAGCDVRADVHRAPGDGARPVIVWIHGGALIGGHRGNLCDWQRDFYLSAGYTVVSIDYRLAPETKLAGIIEDLRDAFRWVAEEGPRLFDAAPGMVATVGHSAGGYLALMAGFCVHPRPRAIVSFYGYGDIAGAWYSGPDPYYSRLPPVPREEAYAAVGGSVISAVEGASNRGRYYLYLRQNGLWCSEVVGHDPKTEPEAFAPFCPLQHVKGDYPPTLLLHGDQDADVPCEQSVMMAEALAAAGVEHELVTVAGAGHGFDLRDNAQNRAVLARAVKFLTAHVR